MMLNYGDLWFPQSNNARLASVGDFLSWQPGRFKAANREWLVEGQALPGHCSSAAMITSKELFWLYKGFAGKLRRPCGKCFSAGTARYEPTFDATQTLKKFERNC